MRIALALLIPLLLPAPAREPQEAFQPGRS
jgi:hypothetical protein